MNRPNTMQALLGGLSLALMVAGCGDNNNGGNKPDAGTVIKTLGFRFDGVPAKAAVGDNITFTLSVVDGSGKPATGYKGTVKFTSNDATATLPSDYTFTGTASQTFNAQFKLAGKWAISATDSAGSAPSGSAFLVVQGPASRLIKVSGDGQTGAAGGALAQSLVVQAIDDGGNPVGGINVAWSATIGGGAVTPAAMTTADDGKATATATLGPSGTSYSFQAAVANLVGSPVVFTS
jgi:hypothetical protein